MKLAQFSARMFLVLVSLTVAAGASAVEPEICDNALTLVIDDMPQIPASLADIRTRRLYTRELQRTIGNNSRGIAQSLLAAAERDDNHRALRAVTETTLPGQKPLLEVFAEFTELVDSAAPPAEFSLTEVAVQTDNTVRKFLRKIIKKTNVTGHLPVTIEQWLQIYANKAPEFERALKQITSTINDMIRRRDNSYVEIDNLEAVIQTAEARAAEYRLMLDELTGRLKSEALLPDDGTRWRKSASSPSPGP